MRRTGLYRTGSTAGRTGHLIHETISPTAAPVVKTAVTTPSAFSPQPFRRLPMTKGFFTPRRNKKNRGGGRNPFPPPAQTERAMGLDVGGARPSPPPD